MKTLVGFFSALVIALMVIPGCSNVTGPEDADAYAVWKINDEAIDDLSEAPSVDEVLGLSSAFGRGGPRWTDRGNAREFRQLRRQSMEWCITELGLTESQQTLFRECLTAHREAVADAATEYATERRALYDAMKATLADIVAQRDAGTITDEQARALADAAVAEYRADVTALNEEFREEVAVSREGVDDCVSAFLTPEQLDRWRTLRRW